jgi:hypothetical protein
VIAYLESISCITVPLTFMDLRSRVSLIRHKLDLPIPVPESTRSDKLHPDKEQLCSDILEMREKGMSCREIAQEVRPYWTHVHQIVKGDYLFIVDIQ